MLELGSTLLVILAATVLLWTEVETRWFKPTRRPPTQAVKNVVIDSARLRNVTGNGRVALIEFTDYECPFCGQYAKQTAPEVEKSLIRTGLVRHVVFQFPLERIHPHARQAAEAAECAATQGRFWEMHHELFSKQNALSSEGLQDIGRSLGLDDSRFETCLANHNSDAIRADLDEAARLGVDSTPTFFIGIVKSNGSVQLTTRVNGAPPFSELEALIKKTSIQQAASW